MFRVLVVDDDNALRLTVSSAFAEQNFEVDQARDGEEAVNKVMTGKYDLVLLDVNMPKLSGLEALKQIKAYDNSIIVLMLTAYSNVKDAVDAVRQGAYNYLEKPIKSEDLVSLVDRALKAHSIVRAVSFSAPIVSAGPDKGLVGSSNEMKRLFTMIDKLARVDTSVLVRGESGTGKELVAKAIHMNGPRKDERFVAINCSAIPESLIESEFFGHEKGAFTGADGRKIGKFQYADGGTLFLDEIGDISPALQVKLLRALQEQKFTPVGSNREIEVSVRIIAATNRNLEEMIKKGEFREDLFYRLNVLPIFLPPLRERKDDILALVQHFLDKFNGTYGKKISGVNAEARDLLMKYNWPGNIRELENVMEHAFVIESSNEISAASLPDSIRGLSRVGKSSIASDNVAEGNNKDGLSYSIDLSNLDFQSQKEEFEKHFIMSALKVFNGRINQTALHANIPKKTLLRKLEKYGLTAKDYQDSED
ncbi:MAG: sigma-54-dependent transcriptional regulator [Bdellovibrionota bacterium]